MHVTMMMVMTPGTMDLAVLMTPMPRAIKVPPVRIAVHVTMMMSMPVVPIDVDALRLVHNTILGRCERPQRCRLGSC